jgi:hypothetical protein
MKLGKPGWLGGVLAEVTALHRPDSVRAALSAEAWKGTGWRRAHAYLGAQLRERGLLFGAPDDHWVLGDEPESGLFLRTIRLFARMALDIAVLCEAPDGPRREQLFLLFAVLTGDLKTARALDALVRQRKPPHRNLMAAVEAGLEQRARSLAEDPVHGLLLHNGALAIDAQLFGRQAVDYFRRGTLSLQSALRRLAVAGRHKAVLVEVLSALASAENRPSLPARRTILRQLDDLRLPSTLTRSVRERVQQTFEGEGELKQMLGIARGPEVRRWLLEQALLSAVVQGRQAPQEVAFLMRLAQELEISPAELETLRDKVSIFHAAHPTVLGLAPDAGEERLARQMVTSMQGAVVKNFHRLMREVRETGELSVLLARLARGYSPTAEERRRMRAQLIDLAKAVPALALFAAPDGLFLLMALAKVLPFSLLPSAFQDEPEARRKT